MLILAGLMTVFMVFCLMARINLKRFLGYPNTVDIVFTLFCLVAMHGTFSGIVAAAFAGVFMSVGLYFVRCSIGAECLSARKGGWRRLFIPVLFWRVIPASEMRPHWLNRFINLKRFARAATQ